MRARAIPGKAMEHLMCTMNSCTRRSSQRSQQLKFAWSQLGSQSAQLQLLEVEAPSLIGIVVRIVRAMHLLWQWKRYVWRGRGCASAHLGFWCNWWFVTSKYSECICMMYGTIYSIDSTQ